LTKDPTKTPDESQDPKPKPLSPRQVDLVYKLDKQAVCNVELHKNLVSLKK